MLESWQRPCSASCPDLDENGEPVGEGGLDPGRAEECSIAVTATEGQTKNVLISWAPGKGCEITLPDTQPPSDVPDEVALRDSYPTCGTDRGLEDLALMSAASETLTNTRRRCFLDAHVDGHRAELEAYEPTADFGPSRHLIYRSNGEVLVVFFEETSDEGKWFRYSCTGLDEAFAGYEFETTGCGDPEPIN
jgi:hypothetical protein